MSQDFWLDPFKLSTYHVTGETLSPLKFLSDDRGVVYSVMRDRHGRKTGAIIPGRWPHMATQTGREGTPMACIERLHSAETEEIRRQVAEELDLCPAQVSCWRPKH